MSIIQGLLEFFGFVSEKSKIEISNEYLVSGRQGRSTTLKILHAIKKALNGKDSGFKIGKTGDPAKRAKAFARR